MSRFIATILLVSLAAMVCEARLRASRVRLGNYPGFRARIPVAGIDAVIDGVASVSGQYATRIPLPDANLTLSNIDLHFKRMRISKFERPQISYTLIEPNKVHVKVNLPNNAVSGPIHTTRHVFGVAQDDKCDFEFAVKDVALELDVTIDTFENGVPKVGEVECKSSMGAANVNLQNYKQTFTHDIIKTGAKMVRPAFESQACSILTILLTKNLNNLLSQVKPEFIFSKDLALKWSITLQITPEYLQINFFEKLITDYVSQQTPANCEINVKGNPQAILTVSDAIFNDFCYQAHKNGLLNFTVTPNSFPVLYKMVSFQCGEYGACLGNAAKRLPEKYGKDALVEAHFEAPKDVLPSIEFQEGKAKLSAGLRVTLHVTRNQPNAERELAASGNVEASGSFQIRIKEDTAYGLATVEDIKIKMDQPDLQHWETDVKKIVQDIVQSYVNEFFLKGISMKLPLGLKVEDANVVFTPHCAQASGSLNYKAIMKRK